MIINLFPGHAFPSRVLTTLQFKRSAASLVSHVFGRQKQAQYDRLPSTEKKQPTDFVDFCDIV